MLSASILAPLFGVAGLALLAAGRALRAEQDTAFLLWHASVTAGHAR